VDGHPAVVEEALQGDALVARVADGLTVGVSSRACAASRSHRSKKASTMVFIR
jgi:hypothetical protein